MMRRRLRDLAWWALAGALLVAVLLGAPPLAALGPAAAPEVVEWDDAMLLREPSLASEAAEMARRGLDPEAPSDGSRAADPPGGRPRPEVKRADLPDAGAPGTARGPGGERVRRDGPDPAGPDWDQPNPGSTAPRQ